MGELALHRERQRVCCGYKTNLRNGPGPLGTVSQGMRYRIRKELEAAEVSGETPNPRLKRNFREAQCHVQSTISLPSAEDSEDLRSQRRWPSMAREFSSSSAKNNSATA